MSRIFSKPKLLKVYSHPRSGTHFLEAFLAKNFYADKDLSLETINWGHWSNRKVNREGNPYGKLFGHHFFPENKKVEKGIYIYRDGRAVAYSVWKTPNFINKELVNLSFEEFLQTPIDWLGSPSKKYEGTMTILEHWAEHVTQWVNFADKNDIMVVSYEDLINHPYQIYKRIKKYNFWWSKKITKENLDAIKEPVGLLPNSAKKDSWKTAFNERSIEAFKDIVENYPFLREKYD